MMSPDWALPALEWLRVYNRETLINDGLAAVIVIIMLIPQSLAYALLAGLPAEMGLYASILPLIAYALFGSSRTLSVGPVAVVSLMTASAVGAIASQGVVDYASAANETGNRKPEHIIPDAQQYIMRRQPGNSNPAGRSVPREKRRRLKGSDDGPWEEAKTAAGLRL